MKQLPICLLAVILTFPLSTRHTRAANYNEAPELAKLVASGKLPPVEQRLPNEPHVATWVAKDGKIGKYGGVLRRATWEPLWAVPIRDLGHLLLARHSWTADVYPNIARSYEMKDGGREWIIHLREGMKWSDGHPYTVDDIIFWYEDIQQNKEVTPAIFTELKSAGELILLEKIDDITLRIRAKAPYILEVHTGLLLYATRYPKHYLTQFHARYIGKDKATQLAKASGYASWEQFFLDRADFNERINPEKPSLEPWKLVQAPPDNPVIFKRNPYYWAVDKEGNQLPYINEMRFDVVGDPEVVKLKALAGELDYMAIQDIISYPMFKKAEKEGKISVCRWASTAINASEVEFNLTHKDLGLRTIFLDKRFRFAVSHAIDRQMINELVWLGLGEPWQVAPLETSRFYNERLAHVALDHDPQKANKLLDEMGLASRDAKGWRLRPDGERLDITFLAFMEAGLPQVAEIVMDNMKAVGLNINLRMADFGYVISQRKSNAHDATITFHSWGTTEGAFLSGNANHLVSVREISFWAPEWVNWYLSKGERGIKPIPDMLRALEAFDKAKTTLDRKEQEKYFKVITDIAADNLWTIGTVKYPGYIIVTTPKLRNVPRTYVPWHRGDWGRPDLWFYE